VAAIGLSLALVLVYDGVLRAYADWMRATMTGPLLGHVQAHAPEWRKDRAMDRTLRGAAAAVEAARRAPGVASASARIYAPALAAVGEEGFAVLVLGIEDEGLLEAAPGPGKLLAGETGITDPNVQLDRVRIERGPFVQDVERFVIVPFVVELVCAFVVLLRAHEGSCHVSNSLRFENACL
jgi:hypothetical protein